MSQAQFTFPLAAGATFDPLDGYQNQTPRKNSKLTIVQNATAAGVTVTITAQERNILQDSPVPAGGVAGVFPTVFNAPVIGPTKVMAGEKLQAPYTNNTGAPITVNVVIDIA